MSKKVYDDNEVVQYLVFRKDLVMSKPKFAVQACHASLESVLDFQDTIYIDTWRENYHPKVLLEVKNKEQLNKIIVKLREKSLFFVEVVDRCWTELEAETEEGTLTCIGIKPYPRWYLKRILGRCRIYKDDTGIKEST